MVIPAVRLYGDPKDIHRNPPQVTVIVFDHDVMVMMRQLLIGKRFHLFFFQDTDDILGHFTAQCSVKRVNEDYKEPKFPTKLTWYPVMRKGQIAGEVLCGFELLELGENMDYPELPAQIQNADNDTFIPLPEYIKPKEETYNFEVSQNIYSTSGIYQTERRNL